MEDSDSIKSGKNDCEYSIEVQNDDNKSLIKNLNRGKKKNYLLNYKCNKCFGTIMINRIFKEEATIYLICDCLCSQIENITIDDFYRDYTTKEIEKHSRIKIFNNSICNIHNSEKLEYYCEDCKKDICSNCIGRTHLDHTLKDLNGVFISKIINSINEIYIKNDNNNNDNNDNKENKSKEFGTNKEIINIINLLKNLISVYNNYPCYNIYNSIINVYNFYLKSKDEDIVYDVPKDNYIIVKRLKDKIFKKKIRFPRDFKENLGNEKIISINLIQKDFSDLNKMMKYNLDFLEILELEENNISNLAPLIKKEFPRLKKLNLDKNRLGNDNIKFIEQIVAPQLEELILFENNFTQFKIIESVYHFEKLKSLYLGANTFNENFDNKYKFPVLEIIGLSFGVFSDNTINFISNIKFEKLRVLYLNCNNLHSIEFIKNLHAPNIEKFSVFSNYIEDFEPLIKYKNNFKKLKTIILKYNKIKNINNLQELINSYLDIKEIILKDNNIDINNYDVESIIKKIYKNNIKNNIKLEIY